MRFHLVFIYPSVFIESLIVIVIFIQFTELERTLAPTEMPSLIREAEILEKSLQFFD